MKKTIIATAVAAAFALPMAAQADVTVYGKVHNSIMNVDASTGGTATTDQWQVQDHSSRLGFKGSEDLGGGMKAIWKYEQAYDTDAGGAVTGGRNTYVGLAGSFGTFVVGRHDTPYKMAWYAGGVDYLGDSIADMNGSGAGGDNVGDTHFNETRASNAIAYVSPDMSGFKAAVAIVPGETTGTDDGLTDSWSGGLMYKGGGLKVGAGMESLANGVAAAPSEKRWHLTGSYTFDNISLGASYQSVDDDANVNGDEKKTLGLAAQIKFGKNAVGANYRNSDLTTAAAGGDSDIDSWAFFVAHSMSKRTKVYAAIAQHDRDVEGGSTADQETNEYGIGIIHNF